MLPAFNMLAASVIALCWLAIGLTFPMLAVWFGVRVARDLRRIARALEVPETLKSAAIQEPDSGSMEEYLNLKRRVANSMFGR